jgi:flagellin-like protein
MQQERDTRAVSPVIGVILMVSITVLLAATTASFVFGLGTEATEKQSPQVALGFDYDVEPGAGDEIQVVHNGGDPVSYDTLKVVIIGASASTGDDPNGRYEASKLTGSNSKMRAGMQIQIDPSTLDDVSNSAELDLGDATIRVVWVSQGSDSSTKLAAWRGPEAR